MKRLRPIAVITASLMAAAFVVLAVACGGAGGVDVSKKKEYTRKAFKFDHPAAWTVDEKDKDYNPDTQFSLDVSSSANLMFNISDVGVPAATMHDTVVAAQEKLLTGASKEKFSTWGSHTGTGTTLKGKLLTVEQTVRVFVFTEEGKTVLVVEQYPSEEEAKYRAGYDMVASSFTVLKDGK